MGFGFFLQTQRGWIGVGRAAVWLTAAAIALWIVNLLIDAKRPRQLLFRAATGCLVVALCLGYGGLRAALQPERIDAWVGTPVTASAQVLSAKPVTGGRVMELQVAAISSAGRTERCQLKSEWAVWRPNGATRNVQPGDRVRVSGVFVYPPVHTRKGLPLRADLAQAGIRYEFEGRLTAVLPAKSTLLTRLQRQIVRAITAVPVGRPDQKVLLDSIVFGGSSVSAAEKQVFLQAGLLHVLAASGANIMLVEITLQRVLQPVWRSLRLPMLVWSALLVAFTWLFAGLCGFSPSVARAALMASYRQVGRALGRPVGMLDGVALSALVLAAWAPGQLRSASSLLSLVATAALAMTLDLERRVRHGQSGRFFITRLIQRLWAHVRGALAVTLAVEFSLLPLTVTLFQQVTPYAVVTNLLAEPILSVLLPLSALYILIAVLAQALLWLMPIAMVIGACAYRLLSLVVLIANHVAHWPHALLVTVKLPHAAVFALGFYGVCLTIPALLRAEWTRAEKRPGKL